MLIMLLTDNSAASCPLCSKRCSRLGYRFTWRYNISVIFSVFSLIVFYFWQLLTCCLSLLFISLYAAC